MSAHTPGPWCQSNRTIYALNERGFNRFSAQVQDPHTPDAELIANAQLMKAAPDLLAALEAMVDFVYPASSPTIVSAIAAIAKATGVQP